MAAAGRRRQPAVRPALQPRLVAPDQEVARAVVAGLGAEHELERGERFPVVVVGAGRSDGHVGQQGAGKVDRGNHSPEPFGRRAGTRRAPRVVQGRINAAPLRNLTRQGNSASQSWPRVFRPAHGTTSTRPRVFRPASWNGFCQAAGLQTRPWRYRQSPAATNPAQKNGWPDWPAARRARKVRERGLLDRIGRVEPALEPPAVERPHPLAGGPVLDRPQAHDHRPRTGHLERAAQPEHAFAHAHHARARSRRPTAPPSPRP